MGYAYPTWEPQENLFNCSVLLKEYYQRKKEKENRKTKSQKHPKIIIRERKEETTEYPVKKKRQYKKREKKNDKNNKNNKIRNINYINIEKGEAPPVRPNFVITNTSHILQNEIYNNYNNNFDNKMNNLNESDELISLDEFARIYDDDNIGIKKEKIDDEEKTENFFEDKPNKQIPFYGISNKFGGLLVK